MYPNGTATVTQTMIVAEAWLIVLHEFSNALGTMSNYLKLYKFCTLCYNYMSCCDLPIWK